MSSIVPRADLARSVSAVRPALARKDYIPALQHVRFDGHFAMAFDDVSAVSVRFEFPVQALVPGDTLARAVDSFVGESVAVSQGKDLAVTLSCGRSRVKLPTMPLSAFPFEPVRGDPHEVELGRDLLKGIEACLLSVGSDSKLPAQMGVTLEQGKDGRGELYSCDDYTLSRYLSADPVSLPGGTPVILPRFLCEQALSLARSYPSCRAILCLTPGAVAIDFVDPRNDTQATVLSRAVVDESPVDFPAIVRRHLPRDVRAVPVPVGADSAFERALMIQSSEPVKTCSVRSKGGTVSVHSTSARGECDEVLESMPGDDPGDASFLCDPSLVLRGLKACGSHAYLPAAMLLSGADGRFTHLISHVQG